MLATVVLGGDLETVPRGLLTATLAVRRPEVTSCNFTAPIATLGALRNPLEVLLHPNCTQILLKFFVAPVLLDI
jgi:hypothetical protein